MAIRITEDGKVIYENEPDIDRELFPNLRCESGKSAYDQAVEGGYTGSEEDFIRDLNSISTKAPAIYDRAVGAIASFSDGADNMSMKSCVVNIEPIQEGTGNPSPENVRPISGRGGLSVVRCGKNIIPKFLTTDITAYGLTFTVNDDGSIRIFGTPTNGDANINLTRRVFNRGELRIKAGTYTFSTGSTNQYIFAQIVTYDGGTFFVRNATATKTIETDFDIRWLDIGINANNGESIDMILKPQLELGSTATDYEPYKVSTYSVNWETEAGIVYGGTLDVISGKLVMNRMKHTFDGSETWSPSSRYIGSFFCYWTQFNPPGLQNGKIICSHAIYHALNSDYTYGMCGSDTTCSLFITQNQTVDEFKQFLASEYISGHPVQIVYYVAPLEIQLTPQEIATLLGENNIWSDAGNMAVEYPADTKMYIQRLTGSDEDDMVANTNIPDATYFLINNTLYRSTTAIASGDPIVPGTNCTVTNIAEALNTLNTTT